MKSFLKWVFILVVIVTIALGVFLQFFLGKAVKSAVEQNYDKFLAVKMEMKGLDFNILGGSVDLTGVKLSNPEGFTGDYVFRLDRSYENLDVMALLRKEIIIDDIQIKNSDLSVVRNKEGMLNIQNILKKSGKKEEAKPEEKTAEKKTEGTEEQKGKIELPQMLLRNMNITSALDYTDYKIGEKPFNIGLLIEMAAKNLATFGPETQRGTFTVKGHLKENKNEFVIDVKIDAAPLLDIQNPTFDAVAEIKGIDVKKLAAYKDTTGLEEGVVSITSQISCVKGEILPEKSMQKVTITGVKLTEKKKEEDPKFKAIEKYLKDLEFNFPLSGRIEKPQYDAKQALNAVLVGLASGAVKDELKNQLGDKLKGSPLENLFGKDKKTGEESAPEKKDNVTEDSKSLLDNKVKDSSIGNILGGDKEAPKEQSAPSEDKGTEKKEDSSSPLGKIKGLF
jgi:hypothetical protein